MKNKMKNIVKRITIVCIAAVMSMSLFGCMSKSNYLEIDVNSPEVQATIVVVRNYEAEKLLSIGSAARERKVWTKRYHKWPEPSEAEKIYTNSDTQSYVFPYTYKGQEYWINASNGSNRDARYIYKKISDNYRDSGPKDRVMVVGADKTEEVWQLLEILEAGDNIVKGVTNGKVEQHTYTGLDRKELK